MNTKRVHRIIPGVILACACFSAPLYADQAFTLDGKAPGKLFEGIGAVSGGGGTSVLLKDYPEPQRSQILEILFKPNFAASMQTFYVEIGGDGNSTQGSEPTHMRTSTEENYDRGYEWWLMVEAKKRNPALTLDACAWSAPGWVGQDARNLNGNFWSQDMCDYYVKWIKGLKAHYGLDLDAVGCRNERGENTNWVKMFRTTLDNNNLKSLRIHGFDSAGNANMWNWVRNLSTDKALADSVDIIGNHCLPDVTQPAFVKEILTPLNKPIWNTEEHVYNEAKKNYPTDFDAALGCVHLFNTNFIQDGATKIVNWYLCGSTYTIEPYYQQPPALWASSPWSGHYQLKPIIWSYAHYGQFTKVGWKYVTSGCAPLTGGGSAVTLKSDDGDFSIIAETASAAAAQTLTFHPVGLSPKALCVWKTTREAQFVKQADITPAADGTFSVTLDRNAIYSLSTTQGQQKGSFVNIPAEKPFPFPYFENFDHYSDAKEWGYLPHYTADICGVFEIAERPDKAGKCLRQVIAKKPQSWAPEWKPYTILGDPQWADYEVSADILLDDGGWAGVMGHVSNTGNGWDGDPNAFYARLGADGTAAIYVASSNIRGGGRDQQLATGSVADFKKDAWHNVKLRFERTQMTLLIDGVKVVAADAQSLPQNQQSPRGLAGLITGGDNNARNTAFFDNVLVNKVNGEPVPPTVFEQSIKPVYAR